jgi:hypothetical protein
MRWFFRAQKNSAGLALFFGLAFFSLILIFSDISLF